MNIRRALLLAAAVGIPALAVADSVPRPSLQLSLKPYNIDYRDFNFPSGLRVLFQKDDTQPVVSISMVVNHGSTSDPEGKEGIAHLIEHLWFRSVHADAQGKDLPKIWAILRDLGATLNAYTAADETHYMTVAPKDKLIPLLRLESLRLREPVRGVTEDVLLVEREVVRNELRLRYENGGGDAFKYLYAKLFPPGHEYADLGIGTHDSLNACSMPDIVKFTQDYYVPHEATVLVVGDLDLDKTSEYLAQFGIDQLADPAHPDAEIALIEPKGRLPAVRVEPPPPQQPVLVKGETVGVSTEHASVEKPTVIMGWTLPGGYRDDQAVGELAVQTLNMAVYNGIAGKQLEAGKEPEGIGCFYDSNLNVSMAVCFVELAKGSTGLDVPEQVLDSLQYMWTTDEAYRPFQDYVFSYARTQYMANIFQNVDLYASLFTTRVTQAANFIHYTGKATYFTSKFEALANVDKDTVRRFSEKYLNRNRAVATILQPLEEGDLNLESTDAAYRGAPRGDAIESMLAESDLTPAAIAESYVSPDLNKLVDKTLPNGVRLLVMPHSAAPLVQVSASFKGGYESSPLREFAADSWYIAQGGTAWSIKPRPNDPLQIAGSDGIQQFAFASRASIEASAGNVDGALFILRDDLDNFTPSTDGSIGWAKNMKKNLLGDQDRPEYWAQHEGYRNLFPGHPLSHSYNHDEIDALRTTPVSQVAAFWSQILQPTNMTLYVVGNVDPKEVEKAATVYFGGWAGKGKVPAGTPPLAIAYPPPPAPKDRKVVIFDKRVASQTTVSYMCQTAQLNQDNYADAMILGDTISEALWLALREQTGASYGAGAGLSDIGGSAAAMFQGVSIQNDQAALAVKTFLEVGEKAARGQLDTKTIAISKYGRASGYVAGQQSTAQMLGRLQGILERGWTLDFFRNYGNRLAAVSNATMAPLLKPCINHEFISAVGPKDVLDGLFTKAGIAHEIFDWEQAKKDYAVQYKLKSAKEDAKEAAKKGDKK